MGDLGIMAFSSSEGKGLFKDWLFHFMAAGHVKTVFDVGAGAGTYSKITHETADEVKQWQPTIKEDLKVDCSEVFKPYVSKYNLGIIYNNIYQDDIENILDSIGNYDLIIMGDVLEHMEKDKAIRVFNALKKKCKFLWISIPVQSFRPWTNGYDQLSDEWEENPANEHLHYWTFYELQAELGPFLWSVPFPVVAVLIAEGELNASV